VNIVSHNPAQSCSDNIPSLLCLLDFGHTVNTAIQLASIWYGHSCWPHAVFSLNTQY